MESKETPSEPITTVQENPTLRFAPGDRVLVTRISTDSSEDYFGNTWGVKKQQCVGNTGVILRLRYKDHEMYYVNMDDEENLTGVAGNAIYTFPACILKKITKWKSKKINRKN